MGEIRTYRDLIVWQKSHELAKLVLEACGKFPKTDEARIVKKQLIRSCTSIPANIAEGYGGNKGRVFQNSLTIARREANETDYWLFLSYELKYISKEESQNLAKGYDEVRAILSTLITKIEKSNSKPTDHS